MNKGNFSRCIAWGDNATTGFYIYRADDKSLQLFVHNGSTLVNIVLPFPRNDTRHIAITFKPNECKAYVDGIQAGNTDTSCSMATSADLLTLGVRSDSASGYNQCFISEFVIHNTDTPWTQTEILDLARKKSVPSGAVLFDFNGNMAGSNGSVATGTNTSFTASPIFNQRTAITPHTPSRKPTDISGLILDLDARLGVFSDAGTTPATNGQSVYQWNDQSGNGNNVSQATAGNRPTLVTGAINGRDALLSSNTNQTVMTCADNAVLSASLAHIFAVVKPLNYKLGTAHGVVYKDVSGIFTNGSYGFWITNSGAINFNVTSTGNSNWGVQGTNSCLISEPIIMEGAFDGTTLYSWVNETSTGTAGPVSGTLADTTGDLRIFAQKASFSTRSFDGYVGKILVFNRTLTATEREAINAYLCEEFGVTIPNKRGKTIRQLV